MSHHRKRGDVRREIGGKIPNRSKAFPRSDSYNGPDHPNGIDEVSKLHSDVKVVLFFST
jgi:hypothetical protein